jgi:hypothetical protein
MAVSAKDESKLKAIWLLVRRLDLAEGQKPPVMLCQLNIPDNCPSNVMVEAIRKELSLLDSNVIFKLRNNHGSLIIPKGSIPANTVNTPYALEVTRIHQNVKPKERSVRFPERDELLKTTLQSFVARIERLEAELPELGSKRQYRIEREIQDLDHQLSFLNKRFEDAEQLKWKGMLKRNPLW